MRAGLVLLLILLLIGAFPGLGLHSFGYAPYSVLSVVIILLLVLALGGYL